MTSDIFAKLFPHAKNPEAWVNSCNKFFPKFEINTLERVASFLAQCGHECDGFTVFSENLNYSATALIKTWPTHFTVSDAQLYARKPEAIANRAYCNRMGNGNEASGDGWKFRGAGAIQLTGRASHAAFGKFLGIDVDAVRDYLLTTDGAIHGACWFWKERNCNRFADEKDIEGLTKKINGGLNGFQDRKDRYTQAIKLLNGTFR